MSKYAIGQSVWLARAGTTKERVTCPVCFGKLAVTVILGNEDLVITRCDYCGKGYDRPRGYIEETRWSVAVEQVSITGAETSTDAAGKTQARFRYGDCYITDECNLFLMQADAEKRAAELAEEHTAEETRRVDWCKKDCHRSYSWNVGYHGRCIKEAERRIEYHRARYIACKAKAKEPSERKPTE